MLSHIHAIINAVTHVKSFDFLSLLRLVVYSCACCASCRFTVWPCFDKLSKIVFVYLYFCVCIFICVLYVCTCSSFRACCHLTAYHCFVKLSATPYSTIPTNSHVDIHPFLARTLCNHHHHHHLHQHHHHHHFHHHLHLQSYLS